MQIPKFSRLRRCRLLNIINFYAAFIDLKSAFDRVSRVLLFLELHDVGIRGKMWKMLRALYKNTTVGIGPDLILDILCGIREGGMSSPTCFNLHFDSLAKSFKKAGVGIRIGNLMVSFLFFADDIVLLAENPSDLQILLDILHQDAVNRHYSFGVKKCAFIKQEWSSPIPNTIFKLGANILSEAERLPKTKKTKFPPSYKYLGIPEMLDSLNYDIFMRKKKKDFISRLQKVKLVGGHFDGLRPEWASRLYSSQLRPILEFGMVALPYQMKYIQILEDLQLTALRQLFGFRRSTKKETIRVLTGFPSMQCRVSQLILCAHKKLNVIFEPDYYLNHILQHNSRHDNSLGNDVQNILQNFPTSEDDRLELQLKYDQEIIDEKSLKGFKLNVRALLEKIDFMNTKKKLELSATQGSGQAKRALRTVSRDKTYHLSPLLRANIPRYSLAKFIQSVAGCDFLTPHNFRKKPKCRFCNNTTADWPHLFFKCEKYRSQILSKFRITELHPQTRTKIENLVNLGDHDGLTDLLFCADGSHIFQSDISILCPIVAKTCVKIQQDWARQIEKDVLAE